MNPSLPAGTLSKLNNNTVSRAEFARAFVTAEMAQTMPESSLNLALDLTIQLRALRSYYVEYAQLTSEAAVDLSNVRAFMAAGVWDALSNGNRREIEAHIGREVRQINEGIQRAIAWLDKQLAHFNPDNVAMTELMERRLKQYPTYAPKPMRKARRVNSSTPVKQAA
jgi:hypothetical protein